MSEHVILFTGPMGAGKTTAIRAISEISVVTTEADNTDREAFDKATTTVALDYGEIALSDEEKVRLYGIPGQRRFEFMWRILCERAMGMVILINHDARDPLGDMMEYLSAFSKLMAKSGAVIGITRWSPASGPSMIDYADALERAYPGALVPILELDPRDSADVRLALLSLVASIDARAMFERSEVGAV